MAKQLRCFFFIVPFLSVTQAQDVFELNGTISYESFNVADVHVINKTFERNTITDENGKFSILARVGDSIVFSAVQFKLYSVVVSSKQPITVVMQERVNELDEVVLYNKLSGNVAFDMKNSEASKPINFYDLGIPGYTGPKKTQAERRVYTATSGSGLIPLMPIINALTGRTKKLKNRLKLEKKLANIDRMQKRYEQTMIDVYQLPTEKGYDFFDFCSEDTRFEKIANTDSAFEQLDFFIEKMKEYQKSVVGSNE
ncbi:hypothetical protein ABN763_10695 [Spongiivirga sp. MCCC 1A20706]|uniref:hypothetical protein n=1 Tax=Spongiivirga sp. MCCC 1A20706 TaxID=3160963 RepID=UPI003977D2C8